MIVFAVICMETLKNIAPTKLAPLWMFTMQESENGLLNLKLACERTVSI